MEYKIQQIEAKKLSIYPINPRFIKDSKYEKLKKSLKKCPELFEARPCICSDRTGKLIVLAGNMRLRAAIDMGYREIPCIIMSGLTEAQEREINIKDNGDFGEWDLDVLANDWSDLPLDDWGIDLPEGWLSGLNDEVNEIIEDDSKEKGYIRENECPKCGYKW